MHELRSSRVVSYFCDSCVPRAICAAIKSAVCLDAVPDDLAGAMIADRREFMDCTLETVERVTRSCRHYFKRKVIIVAAYFTLSHPCLSSTDYAEYADKSV